MPSHAAEVVMVGSTQAQHILSRMNAVYRGGMRFHIKVLGRDKARIFMISNSHPAHLVSPLRIFLC